MSVQDENMDDMTRSLQGMQRANAPGYLFGKIEQRMQAARQVIERVPLRTVYLAAASLLLLVTVNIVLAGSHKKQLHDGDAMQELVQYYGLTENGRP